MLAAEIRLGVVETARRLQQAGLLSLTAGNLSARVDRDLVAVTPTGMPYDDIQPQDVVITDLDGKLIDGERRPSSELPFHLAVLRSRPDIGAVVHTHSVYATSIAILGKTIPAIHYMVAALNVVEVPIVPYATYGSETLAERIRAAFSGGGRAALLANHGAIALGSDLTDAVHAAELLEFLATVYHHALTAGTPVVLPEEEIATVARHYRSYGQEGSTASGQQAKSGPTPSTRSSESKALDGE